MLQLRNALGFLMIFFFWQAVTASKGHIANYSSASFLTYIIGATLITDLVLSATNIDAQGEISSGSLNNHLLKPYSYFLFYASKDIADKLQNIIFTSIQLIILFYLLKPPFIWPTHLTTWLSLLPALTLAVLLYYFISFAISLSTFWIYQNNGWAQRFFFNICIFLLAGQGFPLDIFPSQISFFFTHLPTAYLVYFPMQIFLERIGSLSIISGLTQSLIWVFVLATLTKIMWHKGLIVYGAYGR